MAYPVSVDSGGVSPAIISNEGGVWASNVTTTLTANRVYLFAFELFAPAIITAARWTMGATIGGKTNMGIYTQNGASSALVTGSDTGQITNVVSSDNTFTYTTPISLAPGQYFMAIACNNATDTYMGRAVGAISGNYRERYATNALTAGALPATTGTLNTLQTSPIGSLLTQGGLL